jgi:predicted metal-dependent RNase
VDLLILESTYGGRTHENFELERTKLVRCLNDTLNNNGSVILASFGLGRAQELLMLVKNFVDEGKLTETPRVFYEGMIREINPVYEKFSGGFSLGTQQFSPVDGRREREEVALRAREGGYIIVTTSGMLAGGPVVHYAEKLLPDPRHRIVLTGYQDEAAPSQAIREATRSGRNRTLQVPTDEGEMRQIQVAQPAVEIGLSAHADQAGLVKLAKQVKPKHIVLVHGSSEAQATLKPKLRQALPDAIIECGPEHYDLP